MATARIVSDPNILSGKPIIAGTRISVDLLLEKMGAGESIEELLGDYPHISRDDIAAALRFAARLIRNEILYPLAEAG